MFLSAELERKARLPINVELMGSDGALGKSYGTNRSWNREALFFRMGSRHCAP